MPIALVLPALALVFAAHIVPYALSKPFWHDELYTVLLARLPLADSWHAALAGADLSPPLNTWLTHGVRAIAGTGPIVSRLPAMAGFFVAVAAIFLVLLRRAGVAAAIAGALIPFFTAGLRYAAEARGYGLMMGLAAAALFVWMEAAAGRRRGLYVPALAVLLAASLWNHYFGVLAFAPILAGEAARCIQRRRIDAGITVAMAAALLAAVPMIPLVRAAAEHRGTFWAKPAGLEQVAEAYVFLLAPMNDRVVLLAIAGVAILVVADSMTGRRNRTGRAVAAHEAAAVWTAVAIPLLGFVLARYVTGVLTPRYILTAVPALAIGLPLGVWRISRRPFPQIALAAVFIALTVSSVRWHSSVPPDPVAARPLLMASLQSPSLTVIGSRLDYLQLWYYAPPAVKNRMLFLADPAEALARTGSDTIERGYLALSRWVPLPIDSYDNLMSRQTSFRLYVAGSGWLLDKLEESGARIEEVGHEPGGRLYQITVPR